MRRYWSKEEEEFLIENYDLLGAKICARELSVKPKRIYDKIERVAIKKNNKEIKVCSKCEKVKPFNDFYKASKGKWGLHAACKKCLGEIENKRYKKDMRFRITKILRRRYKFCVKGKNFTKNKEKIIGCNISEALTHLEKQFTGNMTWENYGEFWEVDHILPVKLLGENPTEELICLVFNYRNLQPLSKLQNNLKSDYLDSCRETIQNKIEKFGEHEIYESLMKLF